MIDIKVGDTVRIKEGMVGRNYNHYPTLVDENGVRMEFSHYGGNPSATFKVLGIIAVGHSYTDSHLVLGKINDKWVSFTIVALEKDSIEPLKRIMKHRMVW